MAKEEKQPEQQVMLSFTPQQLQEMIQSIVEGSSKNGLELVKAFVEENRKPTPGQIEAARRAKEFWVQQEREKREMRERREAACRHIHPHAGKSLFFRFDVGIPEGAYLLVCSRCEKKITNFNDKAELIHNTEFEHWWPIPNLTDGVQAFG